MSSRLGGRARYPDGNWAVMPFDGLAIGRRTRTAFRDRRSIKWWPAEEAAHST